MKTLSLLLAAAAAALTAANAQAQFVKGNEAVAKLPNGGKRVETVPLPKTGSGSTSTPCNANAGCHPGPWHMVETNAGLQECTEVFAREGSCRQSTYGTAKLSRLWIVKVGSAWMWCQYPDLSSKCADMNARPPLNMPTSAVQ